MKNPGTLATMPDGRNVIIYNNQPLLKDKKKVIVTLADENFFPLKEDGHTKCLLYDLDEYKRVIPEWKGRGKCD